MKTKISQNQERSICQGYDAFVTGKLIEPTSYPGAGPLPSAIDQTQLQILPTTSFHSR